MNELTGLAESTEWNKIDAWPELAQTRPTRAVTGGLDSAWHAHTLRLDRSSYE